GVGVGEPGSGQVRSAAHDLLAHATHARVRLAIGYMPEDRRLIPDRTVGENVLVPAWAARLPDARARLERVYELIPEMRAFAERKELPPSGRQHTVAALVPALTAGTAPA